MKTVSRGHYALSVCAATAMLAGCGESTAFPSPNAQTPAGIAITSKRVASPSFATPERVSDKEVLSGNAKVTCHYYPSQFGFGDHFHAHGKATGPYPGTFIASGTWSFVILNLGGHQLPQWAFDETFTITSGASKVSGTMSDTDNSQLEKFSCTSLGPDASQYTSNYGDGNADIQIIEKGDFSETLDGL